MARIRTIKPSLWGDEKVARCTRDARLTYVGLISMADDEGRFLASPAAVAGFVFPNDTLPAKRVSAWLDELAAAGLVCLWESGGVRYGAHLKWADHQKVAHPAKSVIPIPQEVLL